MTARKLLLSCGAISSVLYLVAIDVIAPLRHAGIRGTQTGHRGPSNWLVCSSLDPAGVNCAETRDLESFFDNCTWFNSSHERWPAQRAVGRAPRASPPSPTLS